MRVPLASASLWLLVLICSCTTITPFQLVSSTAPAPTDAPLGHIVEGRACSGSLLYIFRWGDGSLYLAKRTALQQAGARVLGDVSVDVESYSFLFFYNSTCTVLRGRPVLDEQPALDRTDEHSDDLEKLPDRSHEPSGDSNEDSGSDGSRSAGSDSGSGSEE